MLRIFLDKLEVRKCSWNTSAVDSHIDIVGIYVVATVVIAVMISAFIGAFATFSFIVYMILLSLIIVFTSLSLIYSENIFDRIKTKYLPFVYRVNYEKHRKMIVMLESNIRAEEYISILQRRQCDKRNYIRALVSIELLYEEIN